MKILVGLGNPGEKYKNNRHNVGFMFLDFIINQLASVSINEFTYNKKLHSEVVNILIDNEKIILAKPQAFMNLSGQAVKELSKVYDLKSNDLIIIHDDLDIPLGKFKIQKGTGPLLHNGLESIEQVMGTKDFLRVRIGVDNRTPENRINGESYVLQDFREEEKKIIHQLFPKIFERLKKDALNLL